MARAVRARADEFKRSLFRWIVQNSGPPDTLPMSIALLETAIEGHLIISANEKDTLAFVADCFKHATDQPKGKLQ
jgi:hypothetical protein